jgi:putative phosphoesterase
MKLSLLPSHIDPRQVQACLGLISDTHVPKLCAALPPVLFDIFRDVNLILHAGDIGELSVLDQLSAIAPVVAVQGNDVSDVIERELPLQQLIMVAGQRILLRHSHYPDWEVEMQSRKEDCWAPKLAEQVAQGQRLGASVVVFGHTHIPLVHRQDGILLVNPGATAPASAILRQIYPTVALLFILRDDLPVVVHVDISAPHQPWVSPLVLSEGFRAAANRHSASLIAPDLMPDWPPFEAYLRKLMGRPPHSPVFGALYQSLISISHRCWSGQQQYITRADLLNVLDEPGLADCVPAQMILDLKAILY